MSVNTRSRQIADWAVITIFLGAIGLPLVGTLLPDRFDTAANDLRPLASLPQFSLSYRPLSEFPDKFEQYWNDHFAFRGTLIHAMNIAKLRWLRISPSPKALLGRESWLFYSEFPPGTNYDRVRPFNPQELNHWRRVLEQRHDWLERRGCRYLVFIPPDKQSIYPEYLSPVHKPRHAQSRLDQLLAHLREHGSKVEILDIRQPMRAAKTHKRLYHRTDSHWNDHGVFLGYQNLVGTLSQWFPEIRPAPRSDFNETMMQKPDGDLARMVDLAERHREEWLSLVPRSPRRAMRAKEGVVRPAGENFPMEPFARESDNPRLPRAVIFHDSFCVALEPFLSEHFRRISYVWTDEFHADVVEREKPSIVIQEMLERKLGHVWPQEMITPQW
jgi:hypothetical protein